MKITYKLDDIHKITVDVLKDGYKVQYYENDRPLGPVEVWKCQEDIITYYQIKF